MEKVTRYLIYHKINGVFIGEIMGIGFWSDIDPSGNYYAVTFKSKEEIYNYISKWITEFKEYICVPISLKKGIKYASILDCEEAGIASWNPNYAPIKVKH